MVIPETLAAVLAQDPQQQPAFHWDRDAWAPVADGVDGGPELLAKLPDTVDRESTQAVVRSELAIGRTLRAFLAVTVWGWGDDDRGPKQTRWVLTGHRRADAFEQPVLSSVAPRLTRSAELVRGRGPLEGFRYLVTEGQIKGFGPQFLTKWLYFASAREGLDGPQVAPILDTKIAAWLEANGVEPLDPKRTISYARYVNLLREWGGADHHPAQVEQAISQLIREG